MRIAPKAWRYGFDDAPDLARRAERLAVPRVDAQPQRERRDRRRQLAQDGVAHAFWIDGRVVDLEQEVFTAGLRERAAFKG